VTACMCLLTCISAAQRINVDSLQQLLSKTADLEKKYSLLQQINREYYINTRGNYQVENGLAMVRIALQLNDDEKIANSYNSVGNYYAYIKGDNTAALDYLFKAIPYAEKVPNGRALSSLYVDIGVAYRVLENSMEAFRYLKKAEASLPDRTNPDYWYLQLQIQTNLGEYYVYTNNPGKAIICIKSAEKINDSLNYSNWGLFIKILYGSYYEQLGRTDSARQVFKEALELDKTTQFLFAHYMFAAYYIPFLIANHQFTEAEQQAYRLMHFGVTSGNNFTKLKSSEYLTDIYEKDDKADSAYKFAKETLKLKDTLLKQTLLNKDQALNFNEEVRLDAEAAQRRQKIQTVVVFSVIVVIAIIALLLYRNSLQRKKANIVLEKAFADLKATQTQLIQSEKMASLGELTAGIAHEIQNPLNFVNNFSEVSIELLDELKAESEKPKAEKDDQLEIEIIGDLTQNLQKINHHGKRADAIVKGMLEHSRAGSGVKEPTDLNKLADEYLRLSYHGLRSKDKGFNADMLTHFDEHIPQINVIPQDVGRVLLNLFNNAFYAVNQKKKTAGAEYKPEVSVTTSSEYGQVIIKVNDNGIGIPEHIKEKIMQPFFTTKPTGEGTGLGLSLTYDMVVKGHGGTIQVNSVEGEGSEFIISLPLN
jgi:two-component system, NtrC family, sensor kinase